MGIDDGRHGPKSYSIRRMNQQIAGPIRISSKSKDILVLLFCLPATLLSNPQLIGAIDVTLAARAQRK